MTAEVNILYTLETINSAFVTVDNNPPVEYVLSPAEQTTVLDMINDIIAEDNSNLGWLIESNKIADRILIEFYSNSTDPTPINPDVMIYDKGGNVFEDSPIYANMNTIVTEILNVVIP